MRDHWHRREFLKSAAVGSACFSVGAPFGLFSRISAAEAQVTPELVRMSDDMEPLVRLIERTPREKCVEMLAEQLRRGVSYRQFMGAVFLAGLRNFKPARGGPMHNVYVIHSAHQLSLDARPEERLLPLFYALNAFKGSSPDLPEDQLQPFRGAVPAAEKAWDEFHAAMEDWDGERADRAIVALVRSRSAAEIAEGLWRYGARDINVLGHKAIFVSNAWRTLETIGWQHAEPVMRALVLALTNQGMKYAQPKAAYLTEFEKQPYFANVERVGKAASRLPGDWAAAQSDPGITKEILALIRDGRAGDACHLAVTQLVEGKARAGSLWDAVHLAAGELIMREPYHLSGLEGVHAVTSTNALHYAFRASGRAETRLLVLLQAVGWMGEFCKQGGGAKLKNVRITELVPGELPASEEAAAREVLAAAGDRPKYEDVIASIAGEAAPKAFRYAQMYPDPQEFLREARRLICLKAKDTHEYKYPAAIFEDYRLVDPQWRPHMLAATVYYLGGSGKPDTPLVQRAREALRAK